jgi:hypothetical protein
MDMYGGLITGIMIFNLTDLKDIGHGQMMAGSGYQIMNGDGRHFTTVRWVYDSYEGWLWVPDYEWAPAWVVWRGGGDYYGWAPMSPRYQYQLIFRQQV